MRSVTPYEVKELIHKHATLVDRTAYELYDRDLRANPVMVFRRIQKKLGLPERSLLDASEAIKEVLKYKGWQREDIWG